MITEIHAATDKYVAIFVLIALMFFIIGLRFVIHNLSNDEWDKIIHPFILRHKGKLHFSTWMVCLVLFLLACGNLAIRNFWPVIAEDFYKQCETGERTGVQCDEDILSDKPDHTVTPEAKDPLGVRE